MEIEIRLLVPQGKHCSETLVLEAGTDGFGAKFLELLHNSLKARRSGLSSCSMMFLCSH